VLARPGEETAQARPATRDRVWQVGTPTAPRRTPSDSREPRERSGRDRSRSEQIRANAKRGLIASLPPTVREQRTVEVTEVRIKLMEGSEDRLRAFCSITFDHCFVIRDLKIIDGLSGPFVAMPSRKLSAHCHRCHYKNHLRAAYCNQCGTKLKAQLHTDSPQKLYADVAHPVNSECREKISASVLLEFAQELARSAEPGYRSRYDDDFEAISESSDDLFTAKPRGESSPAESHAPSPPSVTRVDPPQPLGPPRGQPNPARPLPEASPRREPPAMTPAPRRDLPDKPRDLPAAARGSESEAPRGQRHEAADGFGAGIFD
jgi:stage V sporulation protein G